MKTTHVAYLLATLALAPGLSGCLFFGNDGSKESAGGAQQSVDQDVNQYDKLQHQLEGSRTHLLGTSAGELAGIANRLYWLDFTNFDPTIHSYSPTSAQQLDYGFKVGTGDDYNYRASEALLTTAEVTGSSVIYHAYSNDKADESRGDLTLDAPGDGTKWYAYAPDHGDMYYVIPGDKTEVWKWTPGQDPKDLFALEDLGVQVGEFLDFGVDSNVMLFIESGRLWSLDLTTKKPTWLGNKTEASGAWPGTDGVVFQTAAGPFYYSYQAGNLRDLASEISHASFKLNDTFASAGNYEEALTRHGNTVGYIGESGFFTYDLASKVVTPILLNARDNSTVYNNPIFLDDGTVFVQGFHSDDGAIGTDGEVYILNQKVQ